MSKTRKNTKNYLQKITNTGKKAIPVLKTVGRTAKDVAVESVPIIEKGVSKVYGTMVEGFDLGVKGVQGITNKMSKKTKKKRSKRHYKGRK